jgi:hypothetical protein
VTAPSGATVTQPNGQIMPVDSFNGEIQLYTLFANLGEPINYHRDAAQSAVFSLPPISRRRSCCMRRAARSRSAGTMSIERDASWFL